jgi:Golgi apyrase
VDNEDTSGYVGHFSGAVRELTGAGVSTFGDKPTEVGDEHLQPLLDHALSYVPKKDVPDTPFFLLATAGMRLLPDHQRARLLQEICTYTRENTNFQLPDCDLHVQVIPGETEGLYGWIAANYLLGGFDNPQAHDHGKGHHTYGFLDMGGASAQIAFAPNATEAEKHANDLKLLRLRTINGDAEEYRVFVTTWLGFGANEARKRYVAALEDAVGPGVQEYPDPCLPAGLEITASGSPILDRKEPLLRGTGKFEECLRQTYPLLEKDKPCNDVPCLLGGIHVPAIDFDVNHFVGVSEYWHTTHEIFELGHTDKAYDFKTYQNRVNEFCSQPWSDIQKGVKNAKWGKKVDETIALEVCFKASWLINMLHDGIGIPRVGLEMENSQKHGKNSTTKLIESAKSKGFLDPFQAVNKIGDTEVSWTLGKMVLYASSQIPPAEETYPVGFGSNLPGVALPKDFQKPGGKDFALPDNLQDTLPEYVNDDGDWSDALFRDSPRRVPGFLLFLLIVAVAVFLLCGREKRKAFYTKLRNIVGFGPCRRKRGSAAATARFGKYDRVVDDVEAAQELELGPYTTSSDENNASDNEHDHSDSTEGTSSSRAGKTPGWATPTLSVGLNTEGLDASPNKRGYFGEGGGGTTGGSGSGLGLGQAWAQGLMSRTESRERVGGALTPGLGRSRPASPLSSRRNPMPILGLGKEKESVD